MPVGGNNFGALEIDNDDPDYEISDISDVSDFSGDSDDSENDFENMEMDENFHPGSSDPDGYKLCTSQDRVTKGDL